jgi:hypothetical protein
VTILNLFPATTTADQAPLRCKEIERGGERVTDPLERNTRPKNETTAAMMIEFGTPDDLLRAIPV